MRWSSTAADQSATRALPRSGPLFLNEGTLIAYNSCRNRHCPKCQGAAAKEWLAQREAELLPVPYLHRNHTRHADQRRLWPSCESRER